MDRVRLIGKRLDGHLADDDRAAHGRTEHPGQHLRAEGAEARRILAAASKRHNGVRWSVAFADGIRQSEAIGLRWKYVDRDVGTIGVGWQLKRHRFKHGCLNIPACTSSRHRRPCPPTCESTGTLTAAQPTAANEATAAPR